MFHLSNYDFLFGSLVLISAGIAIIRGGIAELLSLSTWFIALFVMRHYAAYLDQIIPSLISNHLLRSLITYILAFSGVAIAITLLKLLFNKAIAKLGLGGINYMLGAIFGTIRGIIICALIIIVSEMFNLDSGHSWNKSWFAPILLPTVQLIINAIPANIKNINQEIGKNAVTLLNSESNFLGK